MKLWKKSYACIWIFNEEFLNILEQDVQLTSTYFSISYLMRPKVLQVFKDVNVIFDLVRGIALIDKSCYLIVMCWIEIAPASVDEMQ